MAVLALAQVKAFRRVLANRRITNRGLRHKLMKMALKDIESKLSRFAVNEDPPPVPAIVDQRTVEPCGACNDEQGCDPLEPNCAALQLTK
jgi:hypothetical protein